MYLFVHLQTATFFCIQSMAPLCGCRSTKIGLAMNFYKTIFRLYKIALKSVNNGRNYVWSKLLHFLEHSVYH